jgi:hypothetical protein
MVINPAKPQNPVKRQNQTIFRIVERITGFLTKSVPRAGVCDFQTASFQSCARKWIFAWAVFQSAWAVLKSAAYGIWFAWAVLEKAARKIQTAAREWNFVRKSVILSTIRKIV